MLILFFPEGCTAIVLNFFFIALPNLLPEGMISPLKRYRIGTKVNNIWIVQDALDDSFQYFIAF
jgi:hypothetical protein